MTAVGDEDPMLLLTRAAAFADPDAETRWAIIADLQKRSDRVAFEATRRFAGSRVSDERALAMDVLGRFGYDADRPFLEETLPIVIAACADRHGKVVDCAVTALGHLGDARGLDAVVRHAVHKSREIRLSVAVAIPFVAGDPPAETAIAALIRLSSDIDSDVRDWATTGLGTQLHVDRDDVRDALAARLTDPEGDTAGEALLGLARRHDPRALPVLLAWLEGEPGNLIVEAAAELGHPDALPELLALKAEGWQDDDRRPWVLDDAIAACSPAQ